MSDYGPFKYGDRVCVKLPNKRAFTGRVYYAYRNKPGGERLICVEHANGMGVAYRIRYVTKIRGGKP